MGDGGGNVCVENGAAVACQAKSDDFAPPDTLIDP